MSDSTTSAIDRVFDLVDSGVEKIDRVLNRGKYTEEQHRARRAKRSLVIDTAASVKVAQDKVVKKDARSQPTTATAIAVRSKFRIVEAIAAETGQAIFVVTDGGNARAECNTRELAEKLLRALETSP